MKEGISADFNYQSKFVDIDGVKMHYVESGFGDPILFLHGIPTSCYLWRNVIPHLQSLGRCIAPDLIGFGRSDKPNIAYTIEQHIHYVTRFIEKLQLNNLIVVMHGWGSLIGLDYIRKHESRCRGIVLYEAFLRESDGSDLSLPFEEQRMAFLKDLNQIEADEAATLSFIDKLMPQPTTRSLTAEELRYYRQPFETQKAAKPLIQYVKELPGGSDYPKVKQIIHDNAEFLKKCTLPKLLLYSVPGFIMTIASVIWAKDHLQHLEISDVGDEEHWAQETHPTLMGETISVWLQGIEQTV